MMEQFCRIKAEHPDELLLFRMGDFYETFYDDAEVVSRVLGITLTSRQKGGGGERIPLAGFPWHALDGYLSRLVRAGHRVAVCEQTEDPAAASGLVRREVVEVVTPGTLVSGSALEERRSMLLCSAFTDGRQGGLALCDLSTGEMDATELEAALVPAEVARRGPRELLLPEGTELEPPPGCELTGLEPWKYDADEAASRISGSLGVDAPEGLGLSAGGPAVRALGALLAYVRDTKRTDLSHLSLCGSYRREDYLIVDRGSARALALVEARQGEEGSVLADVLDGCATPAGSRELRDWLISPPRDAGEVSARHDAVQWLVERPEIAARTGGLLRGTTDLRRQAGKLGSRRSSPRDLRALASTLAVLPELCRMLEGAPGILGEVSGMDRMEDLRAELDGVITDDPPARLSDGGVIRPGVSEELDELRRVRSGGREWIESREEQEREATGIPNLTIGYNKVFGYYIEVSKGKLDLVPEHYIRKQTLVGGERFITPELKEVEARVLRAGEEMERLETALFVSLRERMAEHSGRVRGAGALVAALDVLSGLASLASERGYVRPELSPVPELTVREGRHPVLERVLPPGECVPNDLSMDPSRRILLVTGPNMAGKSTYLRQAALLVVMAQAGSFVPASSMRFSPVDRIFTRIGSADRITRGQSTFLVEMAEAASLLNSSTERSLAILDEVGRGTSTYDGLSLAWAMVEYLQSHRTHRPLVLFATHYHELTSLPSLLPGLANVNVAVREKGDGVAFLYRVEEGATDRSYGIHVASMAGVPGAVVRRARRVLADLEAGRHLMPGGVSEDQLALPLSSAGAEQGEDPLVRELREMDPDEITPRRALEILYELRDRL